MAKKKRTARPGQQPRIAAAATEQATLSPRQSTRVTGIGITNTYRLLQLKREEGGMPHIKIGNRFFIPRAALLKWLETAGSNLNTAA